MKRIINAAALTAVAVALGAVTVPLAPVSSLALAAAENAFVPPHCSQSRMQLANGQWKTILDCPSSD